MVRIQKKWLWQLSWLRYTKKKSSLTILEKENTKTHLELDFREKAVAVPLIHLFFLVIYKSICLFINGKLWGEWKTAQWRRRVMKFICSFLKTDVLKGNLSKQATLPTSQCISEQVAAFYKDLLRHYPPVRCFSETHLISNVKWQQMGLYEPMILKVSEWPYISRLMNFPFSSRILSLLRVWHVRCSHQDKWDGNVVCIGLSSAKI